MNPTLLYSRLNTEDIGLPGFLILLNIEVTGEYMKNLASLMEMTQPNCGEHVKRLEKKGLVHKEPEGNRCMVSITEAGKQAIRRIEAA